MAKQNGKAPERAKLLDLQLFRVRREAHTLAKAAAASAGVTLEEWASAVLIAAARRQLDRSAAKRR